MNGGIDRLMAEVLAKASRAAQPDALAALGEDRLAEADLDNALRCFDRALQIDPRSARAWTGRASVLARRKRLGEALGCVGRALDAQPRHVPSLALKAQLLVQAGQRDEALAVYDVMLVADPTARELWIHRGKLLEELERWSDALSSFQRALDLEDTADVWMRHADLLMQQGKLAEAATSFTRVLALAPRSSDAWYRLARARMKLRDGEGARDALERFLGVASEGDSRASAARKMLAELTKSPSADVVFPESRPMLAAAESAPDAVAKVLAPPAPSAPMPAVQIQEAPDLDVHKRVTVKRESQPEIELEDAPRVTAPPAEPAPPPSGPTLDEIAALLAAGRDLEALRAIGRVVATSPSSKGAWLLRSRILISLGQLEAAITSLETLTRLDRGNAGAWRLMATCWSDLKRPDRALEIVQRAIDAEPADPETHRLRARLLIALKRTDDAREALETTLELAETCRAKAISDEVRAMLAELGGARA